jgi:hypothetical protein
MVFMALLPNVSVVNPIPVAYKVTPENMDFYTLIVGGIGQSM